MSPAPAMGLSGGSAAGTWPDPAVLGCKLTEKKWGLRLYNMVLKSGYG